MLLSQISLFEELPMHELKIIDEASFMKSLKRDFHQWGFTNDD